MKISYCHPFTFPSFSSSLSLLLHSPFTSMRGNREVSRARFLALRARVITLYPLPFLCLPRALSLPPPHKLCSAFYVHYPLTFSPNSLFTVTSSLCSLDTGTTSQSRQVGQRFRGSSHAGESSGHQGQGEGGCQEGVPPGGA